MGARTRLATALGSGLVLILGTLAPVSAGATSPPDWQPTATRLHIESPARAAIERAIDPDDYECGPTQLDAFVGSLVAEMTLADLQFLFADDGLVLNLPTYDAWFFGSNTDSRYALRADYSQLLTKSFQRRQALLGHPVRRHPVARHARRHAPRHGASSPDAHGATR